MTPIRATRTLPPSHRVGVPAIRLPGARPQGAGTPKIVINHNIEDVERWLKYKAERVAILSPFGSNVTDHVAPDGSNNVAVTADVHDVAALQAAIGSPSPELAAGMHRHGVLPPLTVHIEK